MKISENLLRRYLLSALFVFSYSAHAISTYDYDKDKAYLITNSDRGFEVSFEYLKKNNILLVVDFLNFEAVNIHEKSTLARSAFSLDNEYVAYFDRKNFHIYSLASDEVVKSEELFLKKRPVWSNDSKSLAIHALNQVSRKEFLYEVSMGSGSVQSVFFQQRQYDKWTPKGVWGIEWSKNCSCFLYEISDSVESTDHQIVRIKDGQLIPVPERKSLFVSPDKTRYFVESEYGDGGGEFTLMDYKTDKPIAELGWFTSSIYSHDLLWKGNVVRVLGRPSWTINIKDGSFLKSKMDLKKMQDVAVDPDGFVLMWDTAKEKFFVQDIQTMEIVKTYEAFWLKKSSANADTASQQIQATPTDPNQITRATASSATPASDTTNNDNNSPTLIQHSLGETRIPVGKDTFKTDAEPTSNTTKSQQNAKTMTSDPEQTNIKNPILILILTLMIVGVSVILYIRRRKKK